MTSKEEKCSTSAEGGASYNGSEQHADRPAVVVSNNKNNENSNVVEVVYMTTQPKTDLPTHVTIRSTGRISTVLCEQVYSVSTERIGTYIGEATDKEMENIDIALMISLQLDNGIKTAKEYYKTIKEQQEEIDSLKREIETMQQEHCFFFSLPLFLILDRLCAVTCHCCLLLCLCCCQFFVCLNLRHLTAESAFCCFHNISHVLNPPHLFSLSSTCM